MATRVKLIHTAISPTLAGASFTGDVNFEGGQVQYDASSNSLDLQDSIYLQLGTDNDLRIYHDGSHARLRETTGDFRIQTTSSGVNALVAKQNAAVEIYHAGAKKLETSSTGATVTGNLTVTGDLDITGNVNSASVTDLDVEDKTITLGVGQTEAQSGSSGIIIDGSNASLLWDETNDEFVFNKNLKSGSLQLTADTSSYTQNANISYYSSSNAVYINGPGDDGWLRLNAAGSSNDRTAINLFGVNQGDFITMKTNSTERIRIDSSGRVGIGTTSPASVLSVQGDGLQIRIDGTANTSRGLLFRNTGTAEGQIQTDGNMHFIQEDANRYMRFSTANTERMRIDSSGHVGIGRVPESDHYSGIKALALGNGPTIYASTSGNPNLTFNDNSFLNSAGNNEYQTSNPATKLEMFNGTLTFSNAASGTAGQNVSFTERMRIDANGRVGVNQNTIQKTFEAWNSADNDFVSVGVRQHSTSTFQGIHFGYAEPGNTVYRKSAIVFERTDLTSNNAQGKVHILNGPQAGSASATLSDRKITIMENGNIEAPFIRAGAWSGQAMHTNGTDALEIGVSGGIGYVHGYDRTNAHYIELAYDGTTHRFATSGGYSNVHIDANGNMAVNTGENSNTAANVTNSLMDGLAHTGTVLSNNGPVVMGRADGSNSGETGYQYANSNEPRCIRNFFTYAGPSSNSYSSPYIHMKTNLWAGGSPHGNTEFTMSCFTFYDYYGYGSNYSCYGVSGWHNWSGGYYNKMLRNYGNWDIAFDPYTSSDGYVVIVARVPNAYSQFSVDWAQWGGYAWRERKITNVAQHNAATGKY